MNYWINTISRDHVMRGVTGGFAQANHGQRAGVARLKHGDWMVFYSPKSVFVDGEPLQAFTAICQITDNEPYQVHVDGREPWRRAVDFKKCVETPIKPLIGDLSFISDKTHWGYKFRFGLFQIPQADFELIHRAMGS
jgi:EVE domain-containing protein